MKRNPETAIQELKTKQSRLLEWLGNIQVTTDEEQRNTEDLLIAGRQAWKEVDTVEKSFTKPLNEARTNIIAFFKPYKATITERIDAVNTVLQDYHAEQMGIAEAERILLLAEQAAKIAEAQETGEVIDLMSVEAMPASPAQTSHANLGSVNYRGDFDVQIVDATLVPRQYCDPNISRIRAAAKSGITEIPGVLITKKFTTYTRGGK